MGRRTWGGTRELCVGARPAGAALWLGKPGENRRAGREPQGCIRFIALGVCLERSPQRTPLSSCYVPRISSVSAPWRLGVKKHILSRRTKITTSGRPLVVRITFYSGLTPRRRDAKTQDAGRSAGNGRSPARKSQAAISFALRVATNSISSFSYGPRLPEHLPHGPTTGRY